MQEAEERNTTLSAPSIKRLLHLWLTSTYFMWNNRFYQQKEGAALGNPPSPVMANNYMQHFEALAIESAWLKPATWLWHVDDTFVVWNEGRDKLQEFLEHLNTIRPSIQFMMELEEDRKLPFLKVLVTWGADKLTTVYIQDGNSHRPVHSLHFQPPQQGQAGRHQMLEVESDKELWNRGSGSRGGPPKDDIPEKWLPREVHRKCKDAKNQIGGIYSKHTGQWQKHPTPGGRPYARYRMQRGLQTR